MSKLSEGLSVLILILMEDTLRVAYARDCYTTEMS